MLISFPNENPRNHSRAHRVSGLKDSYQIDKEDLIQIQKSPPNGWLAKFPLMKLPWLVLVKIIDFYINSSKDKDFWVVSKAWFCAMEKAGMVGPLSEKTRIQCIFDQITELDFLTLYPPQTHFRGSRCLQKIPSPPGSRPLEFLRTSLAIAGKKFSDVSKVPRDSEYYIVFYQRTRYIVLDRDMKVK